MPRINTLSLVAASAGLASMATALPVTTTAATTATLVGRAEIVPSSTTETHLADTVTDLFLEAAKSHSLIPIAEATATSVEWNDESEDDKRIKKILEAIAKGEPANITFTDLVIANFTDDWRMARRQVLSKRINITDDEREDDDTDDEADDEEDVAGDEAFRNLMDRLTAAGSNVTLAEEIIANETSHWKAANPANLTNVEDADADADEDENEDTDEDDEEDVADNEAFRHLIDRLTAAGSNRTLALEIFTNETSHWGMGRRQVVANPANLTDEEAMTLFNDIIANVTAGQPINIARRQLVANPANLTDEEAKPLMQKIEVMLDEYDKLVNMKKEMEAAYAKLQETAPVNHTKILPTTDRPAILTTKEGRELEIKLAHGRYEIWQEFAKLERSAGVNGTHIKEQLELMEEETAFFLGKNEQQVEDALEELEEQEREELIENLPEGPWER